MAATNDGSRFASQIICISEISYRSEKSSNGQRIARIAPILMIFGPIESQRHDLFLQKILNEQRNEETDKNFENFSNCFRKLFRKISNFFRSFCRFLRFAVRSKIFEKIDLVAAIFLVLKSSKSELSSRFSGRLKFSQALDIFLAVLKQIQAERNQRSIPLEIFMIQPLLIYIFTCLNKQISMN